MSRAVACLIVACVLLGSAVARAQDTQVEGQASGDEAPWGVVRVISESAEIRTGPGFAFRAVHVVGRGETLRAVARANRDFWFQVELPDGTFGWILGDQVLALNVDSNPPEPPGFFGRIADAIFSPPPLLSGDVGLAFSAGFLGGEGMVMFRPSILLAPHLAIEGFVGETVGDQVDVLYYGAVANLFVWPRSPVTLFFSMGGGGVWGRAKVDQVVQRPTGHRAAVNAGGGLLISFKKRVTLRLDARNYVAFDANDAQELQEYSGGLAIVF
jgi:hypothetical protein